MPYAISLLRCQHESSAGYFRQLPLDYDDALPPPADFRLLPMLLLDILLPPGDIFSCFRFYFGLRRCCMMPFH